MSGLEKLAVREIDGLPPANDPRLPAHNAQAAYFARKLAENALAAAEAAEQPCAKIERKLLRKTTPHDPWRSAMTDEDPKIVGLPGRDERAAKPKRAPKAKPAPEPTDDRIADAFAEEHRNDLRYVAAWGKWFEWHGKHWREEKTLRAFDLIRKTCRAQGIERAGMAKMVAAVHDARPRRPASRRDHRAMGRRPDAAQHPGRRCRPERPATLRAAPAATTT